MTYTKDYLVRKDKTCGRAKIILPRKIVAGAGVEIKVEFIAGRRGLKKGSLIRLEIPYAWIKPNADNPNEAGYSEFSSSVKIKAYVTACRKCLYGELSEDLPAGEKIRIIYNLNRTDEPHRVSAQVAYPDFQEAYLDVRRKGDKKYLRLASARTKIIGGKAVNLFLKIPSVVAGSKPFVLTLIARDEFDNIAQGFTGTVLLSTPSNIRLPRREVTFGKNDGGRKTIKGIRFTGKRVSSSSRKNLLKKQDFYFILPPPPEMENVAVISGCNVSISGSSNPIWRAKRDEKKKIYWGDIHVHTRSFSDGMGSANDAYYYMKEVSLLDFGGLGDHSFQGWHPALPEIPERDLHISQEEWIKIIELAKKKSVPGKFVGVPGYEWSARRMAAPKDWPYEVVSDKCVYFANYHRKNPLIYQNQNHSNTPKKLYSLLKKFDALIISHSSASAPMGTAWEALDNREEPVVEIYSMHGSSEYYGNPRPLVSHRKEGYVSVALKRGLKLGFIAGGDDHFAHPGCRTAQRKFPYQMLCTIYRPGLTAVVTDNFSLRGIVAAIRKRHCYATTGERIFLDFRIGRSRMGDEIKIARVPLIEVTCAGTDTLEKVEIIKNGKVVFCRTPTHRKVKFNFLDEKIRKGKSYYYLRVTQVDGEMAWSSPIWVDYRP